jgi:hypothetical protein
MTDEQINQQIAEACGWAVFASTRPSDLLNYCNCLNAMHEAEKGLGKKQVRSYALTLAQILDTSPTVDLVDQFLNIHATARQRAEAFLRTLGKWKEDK